MTTAREEAGNLIISLTDGTEYVVPPLPGKQGIECLAILVGLSLGTTLNEHGPEKVLADTEKLTKLTLGIEGRSGAKRRKQFDSLRASQQAIVGQAATLWNVQGGGIDAVNDLLDEEGGYPKALERVMESCGLGEQFKLLRTWLNGGDPEQN